MEFELKPEYTIDDFDDYWRGFAAKPPGKKPPKQGPVWAQKFAACVLIGMGGTMVVMGLSQAGESLWLSVVLGVLFASAGLFRLVRGVPEHPKWAQKAWDNYVKQGINHTYRFTEEGIEVDLGTSSHRFDYTLVQQLWEDEGHFYLFAGAKSGHMLNKNSFDKGDPSQFAAFLTQKTGKPVRWVDGEDQRPLRVAQGPTEK